MQDQVEELRRNIVVTLQNGFRVNPDTRYPAQLLAELLEAEPKELYNLMEELTQEGYLETLTTPCKLGMGHDVADRTTPGATRRF